MTGKQRAVLWLGLIMIAFNLVRKWPEISSVIFSGAAPAPDGTGNNSAGNTPSSPSSGSVNQGGTIQIPIDPFLPTGPKITIPVPKL